MADDDIDIEGEFNFKLETVSGLYDTNELPSKSANLLPEFTNPPWMLEQGWSLDNGMDEKSKATIEKMLLEEQQYMNGCKKGKHLGINKSVLLITAPAHAKKHQESTSRRQWTDEEKKLFLQGLERFGHRWSKISKLISTRTTIQVKNYAKQFFKIQAKVKPEINQAHNLFTPVSPSSDSDAVLALGATGTASPLSDSKSVVSTASPAAVAHSLPRDKAKPKSARKKVVNEGDTWRQSVSFVKVDAVSPLVRNRMSFASSVNGCVTEDYSPECSADVSEAEKHRTGMKTSINQSSTEAVKTSVLIEKTSDSGSESDVDIENDDEDEGNTLQSRVASPTSVYNRLLEQANICGDASQSDSPHEQDELEEEADNPDGPVSDEDREDSCNKGEGFGTGHIGLAVSSVGSSMLEQGQGEPTAAEWTEQEPGPLMEEQAVHSQDIKHIVNGLTASNGKIVEFPIPIEDRVLERDNITDEEKMVHSEFFDGRPLKTPERYLKIRNYILDCWKKTRPGYLNKTSVRPGLKNCGDVNCIGRIHAYLECTGAINFGCEQTGYNNPGRGLATVPKLRHLGKDHQTAMSVTKLVAMRPRKRRIRDASGLWVDEKELEGKTIEHKPEDDDHSRPKSVRNRKVVYDPFKLVPCQPFTQDKQAPFQLQVMSTALAVMDIHAHISRTEVIGMLGGQFDADSSRLTISIAIPCKSISTGMQCEMDPVSQTHASEQIEDVGMCVVGWYHSHPTFAPNPSVRDIETQQKFQNWFAKGGSHFVGVIISPYSPHNSGVVSDVRCLTIGDEIDEEYLCNTPYQFSYSVVYRDNMREILGPASDLAEKYASYSSRVRLSCIYKSPLGITCLSKMLQSVKNRLEPTEEEGMVKDSHRKVNDILHWLEQIFLDKFSSSTFSDVGSDSKIIHTTTAVPPSDDDVQV